MPVIGVAIEIPEPYGTQLRQRRASYGDVRAATVPAHITLIPPTEVDDAQFEKLEENLAQVAQQHSPFDITLRGTGTFRPVSPVVFVSVVEGISPTEQLAADARALVDELSQQFPYHPHVTVAQEVSEGALDQAFNELSDFQCRWRVEDFCMYTQNGSPEWRKHRQFNLA